MDARRHGIDRLGMSPLDFPVRIPFELRLRKGETQKQAWARISFDSLMSFRDATKTTDFKHSKFKLSQLK
jgi:hypothetical protein